MIIDWPAIWPAKQNTAEIQATYKKMGLSLNTELVVAIAKVQTSKTKSCKYDVFSLEVWRIQIDSNTELKRNSLSSALLLFLMSC